MIKNVHGNTLDLLGEAIVAGRYAAGAALPPEPLLCENSASAAPWCAKR